MTTVRFFWHAFIHRSTTFMYIQYSHPLIYHFLLNVWKASYTISASIFVDVPYWPPYCTDKFISCVVPGPSQWFFHFGEEIVITWTNIGWVRWMFQRISHCQRRKRSVTAAAEWRRSSRVVVFSWPLYEGCAAGTCDSIVVPLLHFRNLMGYTTRCNFVVTQNVVDNVGHILRLPLLTHAQSIGDQLPSGKQGVELLFST